MNDGDEVHTYHTDPNDPDTDGDGLPDGWEVDNGLDPNDSTGDNGADGDPDGDGLDNAGEYAARTDPVDPDSDDDGLNDGDEVDTYGTDPADADSDDDGLNDGDEVDTYGTDPADADSDDDGLSDWDEVNVHGTDPLDEDSDDDGLSDYAELLPGLGPCGTPHPSSTPGADIGIERGTFEVGEEVELVMYYNDEQIGIAESGWWESRANEPEAGGATYENLYIDFDNPTDSLIFTITQGMVDGLDPGDGLSGYIEMIDQTDTIFVYYDFDELCWGAVGGIETDPLNPDTDGDGYTDGFEVARGSDPNDPRSTPTRGGSGEPCFIATAGYGAPTDVEVGVLRDFRDRYLLTNRAGTACVRAYYRLSPPVARFIMRHEPVRNVVRAVLSPVVALARFTVCSHAATKILLTTVALCVFIVAIMGLRRQRKASLSGVQEGTRR